MKETASKAYEKKPPLIVLTGPTAVGKTELSIALAKAIGGEIISADSMQVYKHMDIGSAKISKEEMRGVPHHLIDVLEPDEPFHVVKFKELAKAAIQGIQNRGHIPIVVGGTGFYIQALVYDIDFTENGHDTSYRQELELVAAKHGEKILHEQLAQIDEKAALEIHPNNVKRVVRALEFFHQTGERISEHNERERQKESPYDFRYFVLNDDRNRLYRRIDCRVDAMLEDGLLKEVQRLRDMGYTRELTSMQGLGYKEMLAYLEGECSLEEAIRVLKRDTRHFAKRQLTWFKRERDVIWIDKQHYDYDGTKILEAVLSNIAED